VACPANITNPTRHSGFSVSSFKNNELKRFVEFETKSKLIFAMGKPTTPIAKSTVIHAESLMNAIRMSQDMR
jgi:hypothetical protein